MSTSTPTPAAAGKGLMLIGILVLAALVIGGWFMSVNNRLIALDEGVKTQWGQVETVLQRRFDLIPNLVATVKGYAEHEQETLTRLTELRSQWGAAKTVDEKAKAAGELEGVLARLLVVAENYPMLKADQGFRDLQTQLEGTENRVTVERQRFNETVKEYNTAVRQFPASFVAGFRGFAPKDSYFEAAPAAQEAPQVDFSK